MWNLLRGPNCLFFKKVKPSQGCRLCFWWRLNLLRHSDWLFLKKFEPSHWCRLSFWECKTSTRFPTVLFFKQGDTFSGVQLSFFNNMKPSQGPQVFFKNVKTSPEHQIMWLSQGPPNDFFERKFNLLRDPNCLFLKKVKPSWGSQLSFFFKKVKPSQWSWLSFTLKMKIRPRGPNHIFLKKAKSFQRFRLSFLKKVKPSQGSGLSFY